MKKYNNQTGCYKIDIFVNGRYLFSTDMAKSCKQAVARVKAKYAFVPTDKVTANFDRS
jgi:uncharacterized protein (UPF0303 family)